MIAGIFNGGVPADGLSGHDGAPITMPEHDWWCASDAVGVAKSPEPAIDFISVETWRAPA